MINLHQRFNHYLNTDKKLDLKDVNEKLISYGWVDDGKDLTGYYVLTENYELVFDLKDNFQYKVPRKSQAAIKKSK
ncbi:hypothetical protein KNU05_gp088 [Synechococcus virus S-PRM1]|jgi:hypothetical protein|uniref:Uncharacterized protein n=1 Tax=Synechococcus virus S-PRM1 TaxID=2100130 RepID=A0A346FKG1_9CAUD|nr:hypothetical protein KNU05_gp088 [Synechococcus virus S-PRM1]AXN58466.1 hypothetical protein [Synechococcus virus S-PRM1]